MLHSKFSIRCSAIRLKKREPNLSCGRKWKKKARNPCENGETVRDSVESWRRSIHRHHHRKRTSGADGVGRRPLGIGPWEGAEANEPFPSTNLPFQSSVQPLSSIQNRQRSENSTTNCSCFRVEICLLKPNGEWRSESFCANGGKSSAARV